MQLLVYLELPTIVNTTPVHNATPVLITGTSMSLDAILQAHIWKQLSLSYRRGALCENVAPCVAQSNAKLRTGEIAKETEQEMVTY